MAKEDIRDVLVLEELREELLRRYEAVKKEMDNYAKTWVGSQLLSPEEHASMLYEVKVMIPRMLFDAKVARMPFFEAIDMALPGLCQLEEQVAKQERFAKISLEKQGLEELQELTDKQRYSYKNRFYAVP